MSYHLEALKTAIPSPLWHDPELMPEPKPALQGDKECELLIVGGGFTGLWAALQVKERKPDTDIILIEQTFVGDGASGRNGGFLNTSLMHGKTNAAYHFPGETDRIEELGKQNIKELLASLEEYQIDARYEKTGEMVVALDRDAVTDLREECEDRLAAGEDVVWFDENTIREQVSSPLFLAGCWGEGGQDGVVDPFRLCVGLRQLLMERFGVRVYESTKMIQSVPDGSEGMTTVCESGVVTSKKVFLATNAYASPIRKVNRSTVPVWDYQLATEPLTNEQLEQINWGKPGSRHALSDHCNMFHYFRLTKDNRITWGGGSSVRYYFNGGIDQKFMDAPDRYEELAREFFEFFPQLQGTVTFSHKWGGIIASSTRFCMVPGVEYGGRLAWSLGYTGSGVSASRFGARIGIELLGYEPSDILNLQFVSKQGIAWPPEPWRWIGIWLTQSELIRADNNGGRRGLWLKFLDKIGLGFAC